MLKKPVWLTVIAPLAAMGLVLSGCGGGDDGGDESGATTLRANWGTFPESWEPGSQEMEPGYMRVPYETLVLREPDGTILPNLATEWEFSDGATALTLTLRDDVQFHDGTEFNAEAVKANAEYVRDEVGGQFGGPLRAGLEAVEAVGEYEVEFTFTRPYPTFIDLLSQRNLPIASPAAIEDGTVQSHPVGTGAWSYDEARSVEGTRMFFGRFDDYWGDQPAFANIELYAISDLTSATAALLGDDLDVTYTDNDELPRIEGAANADHYDYPAVRNNVTFFDRGPDGVFADQRVRQALCLAMDAQVVADLDGGTAASQHFTEGEAGYNPDITPLAGNLDEAESLLEEAGSPELTFDMPSMPFNQQQVMVYADQMGQLPGVTVNLQELAPAQYISSWNSGQYALGVGNHPQITPADWYGAWFSPTAQANPAQYTSDELTELGEEAQAAQGSEEADEKWQAVMAQISEEALTCSHYVSSEKVAYNTETVDDVQQAPQSWEQKLIDYHAITPRQ